MRIHVIYGTLLCMSLFASCSSNPTGDRHLSDTALEEVEPCLIPLDSVTTQSVTYIQLIDDHTMAFFNRPSYEICIVDLKSKTTDKQKVFYEGPNSVPQVDAFCYVSPDSIWLYES